MERKNAVIGWRRWVKDLFDEECKKDPENNFITQIGIKEAYRSILGMHDCDCTD